MDRDGGRGAEKEIGKGSCGFGDEGLAQLRGYLEDSKVWITSGDIQRGRGLRQGLRDWSLET